MTFDDNDAQLYNDRGVVYDSLGFHKEALRYHVDGRNSCGAPPSKLSIGLGDV